MHRVGVRTVGELAALEGRIRGLPLEVPVPGAVE